MVETTKDIFKALLLEWKSIIPRPPSLTGADSVYLRVPQKVENEGLKPRDHPLRGRQYSSKKPKLTSSKNINYQGFAKKRQRPGLSEIQILFQFV